MAQPRSLQRRSAFMACAALMYIAMTTFAVPTMALAVGVDGTLPRGCGHEQIIAAQGNMPLPTVTLRHDTPNLRYHVEMHRNARNSSADATAPRDVMPQATVTVSSADATWAPIRIAVFTSDLEDDSRYCTAVGQSRPDFTGKQVTCTSTADILTDAKKSILINYVLPEAVNMHVQRLLVQPLAAGTNIVVNSMPGSYCGSFTVPAAHRTTGVPNADFVVYVGAGPTSTPTAFIAWAIGCQNYPNSGTITNRPAVGAIYFNPRYLPSTIGETPEEIRLYGGNPYASTNGLRRTAAHELLHALGFTSNAFQSRGMFATVPSLRGKTNVPVLNSSAVRAATKAQYGIADTDLLYGAELEDQGAPGTTLSHWKRRSAKDELMSPVLNLARYSALSIAAMEDLGFYKGNYSNAEPFAFGTASGAKIFTEPCLTSGSTNVPSVYCDNPGSSVMQCAPDRLSMGFCYVATYSSSLPSYAQYFPDRPNYGGGLSYVDYCPTIQPGSNTGCAGGLPAAMPGSVVGDNSRCFNAPELLIKTTYTRPGAVCAQVYCDAATQTYQVLVALANSWLSCGKGGSGITVEPATSSPDEYAAGGAISCPPYSEVCYANPVAFQITPTSTPVTTTTAKPSAAVALGSSLASFSGVIVAALVVMAVWLD